ncbi:MAG: ABC transporter permease [Bacteroidales bacterium]|nr:ABC transporter permease [Bacteroidales bacterium]
MRIEPLIAVRYLFARKQRSVVNVISWISLIGLMVSTMALIIVLAVYNGIGEITKSLFNTFDPELVVAPTEGKTFLYTHISWNDSDIETVSPMVNESAWVTYGDRQAIVTLRGVDANYSSLTGLDTFLSDGEYLLGQGEVTTLIVGGELFYNMGMRLPSNLAAAVHIPRRGSTSIGTTLDDAFRIGYAYPVGNFFIQQDIDSKYVVTDIDFVRGLMNYSPDECTEVALKLKDGASVAKVKRRMMERFSRSGIPLTVKDRYDQQPLYFKIFRTERLGIYLILSLIVLISTLSLVASLSLLIIGKHRDIFVLGSMGMERSRIRRVFILEGLLICAVAVVAGLLLGFVVCFLQQQFGIIRMGNGSFVVEAFPVAMRARDFLATFLLVMAISSLAVLLTVRRARI